MAGRGKPLLMWSFIGEVAGVVILHLRLHRARWVRLLGAAHLRGGEGCGGAYERRSSSPSLLYHARAAPPLLCHTQATSPLLAVVSRPPPSLASSLLAAEDALRQLHMRHREDARANARVVEIFRGPARQLWRSSATSAAGDEAVALHVRLSEAEAKVAVLRALVEQMEREATERDELWMRAKKQILGGGACVDENTLDFFYSSHAAPDVRIFIPCSPLSFACPCFSSFFISHFKQPALKMDIFGVGCLIRSTHKIESIFGVDRLKQPHKKYSF
jgi:hypothetical protein